MIIFIQRIIKRTYDEIKSFAERNKDIKNIKNSFRFPSLSCCVIAISKNQPMTFTINRIW